MSRRFGVKGILAAVLLMAQASASWAKDLSGLKEKLLAARQKIESVAKTESKDKRKTPPSFEFGELFDEAYDALLQESKQLLKEAKTSDAYRRRMKEFVEVSALAVYLEPGQVSVEIAYGLSKSKKSFQRSAFNDALKSLDPELKIRLTEALRIEERGRREGNG